MSSDDEKKAKKTRVFKRTIAIIVMYATFILLMSMAGFISSAAREILFVRNLTFTVTFITGTVITIAIILIQLFVVKPASTVVKPVVRYSGEGMECPDFWVLKETPAAELDAIQDLQLKEMSRYYCENPRVHLPEGGTVDFPEDTTPPSSDEKDKELYDMVAKYKNSGISSDYHMQCNRMYPDYMSFIDRTKFESNPTALRCNYLKKCTLSSGNHLPWTGICR